MRILQRLQAQPASDGGGVRIQRLAGFQAASHFDPFLMLDEFDSSEPDDYLAGFPPHPHRGFETITYMRAGLMRHEDHLGHQGLVQAGGIQWMRAGRGIIHSEMPGQQQGHMHGFQLWLNLPASEKMSPPRYADFSSAELPEFICDGHQLKLLAGCYQAGGQRWQAPLDSGQTRLRYLDLGFTGTAPLTITPLAGDHLLLYVYQGTVTVADTTLTPRQALVAAVEQPFALNASGNSRALLLLGQPLAEPVAHYGPFVMNSRAELEQAMRDYSSGQLTQPGH